MYQTGPKRHVCRRVRRETAGAAVQASADAGQHVGGARCGDCVGNGHDVQADHHEVGDMHGGRPEHREPGRGCTVDVNTMVGVVAVLTTSSLSRIEGIGIGEGATMFGPTTARVGDMLGERPGHRARAFDLFIKHGGAAVMATSRSGQRGMAGRRCRGITPDRSAIGSKRL
jgi:hypothetical protein